jgi:hypothetical protein
MRAAQRPTLGYRVSGAGEKTRTVFERKLPIELLSAVIIVSSSC